MKLLNNFSLKKVIRDSLFFIFFSFFIISCYPPLQGTDKLVHENNLMENKDTNIISFLVFNIQTDTIRNVNIVSLISKKESQGKFKKKDTAPVANYLSIYAYSNQQLKDSIIVAHPLYKHFEYLDENKQFKVLDTIMKNADFFVRLKGSFNAVKVYETLNNKSKTLLKTLNF